MILFWKKIRAIGKQSDDYKREVGEWINGIFVRVEETIDAPEMHSLTDFDVGIDEIRGKHIPLGNIPEEYLVPKPRVMKGGPRIVRNIPMSKESPPSGRVEKPLRRSRKGSKLDLHDIEFETLTFGDKTERIKEDLMVKAQELRDDWKENAQEFTKATQELKDGWQDLKDNLKDNVIKKLNLTKKEETPHIGIEKGKKMDIFTERGQSPNTESILSGKKEFQPRIGVNSSNIAPLEVPDAEKKSSTPKASILGQDIHESDDIDDEIPDPKERTGQSNEKEKGKGLRQIINDQKEWFHNEINDIKGIMDISHQFLVEKGTLFDPFLDCFGLFSKTSSLVADLNSLTLWDTSNVSFVLNRPVLSGLVRGSYDGWARIESGFLSIYCGKTSDKEALADEPNVVLCLREAIIFDHKYNRFKMGQVRGQYNPIEDETEINLNINKIDYSFKVVNDNKCKWIWAIRLNCGFHPNIHSSFAPVRKHVGCKFLHCGEQYFDELLEQLMAAKSEIFITGWMVSPSYYLQRSPKILHQLDEVLLAKAKEGVRVHLLLWKDPGVIIDNGSQEVESHFNSFRCENIFVIRDPPTFGLIIWSHHQKIVVIDQDIAFIGGIDIAYNRYEIPGEYPLYDPNEETFPGLDYVNPLIRQKNVGDHRQNIFDRSWEPRMPWNDIHCKIVGGAARDVAVNFIERWNYAVLMGKSEFKTMKPFIVPKNTSFRSSVDEPFPNCKVQVVRSVSSWGFGHYIAETSIYEAYISLIEKAKHFIYIENQFFISASSKTQKFPGNKILAALIGKIRNAIKKKEVFKVIIMIPLQTASPIQDGTTQSIMYWQYQSIYRGENSMFEVLQKEFPKVDIEQYVTFTSMRTWATVPKDPDSVATEIIYVHSKCMIVDDRYVIIGSANINDRSLSVGRDSEIAIVIEDTSEIEIKMGGEKFVANKFAHYLRMNLWKKYLRKDDEIFSDPIAFYDHWRKMAAFNSDIFAHVFIKTHSTVKSLHDVKYLTDYNQTIKPQDIQMLKEIDSFIVTFPRDFLCEMHKPKGGIAVNESGQNLYYM